MAGEVKPHRIPLTRGLDPALRRRRLLAARRYQRHTVPRIAILLGQWDAGSVVGSEGKEK